MTLKKYIIPAIIAKNQKELEEIINKVENFVEIIQLDFMDGKFVPNNSIDFNFKLPKNNCIFEAHLMILNPFEWIEKNLKKVDAILIHFESYNNLSEIIKKVKMKNKKIGIVLNPETPIIKIMDYLDQIDQVLIMTVNPGFYGSPFLPDMLDKISELRKIKPNLNIEVDGGITPNTIKFVNKAGANMFVLGSYIVKATDINEAIRNIKKML